MNIDWYDISIKPEDVFVIELKEIWEKNFPKHGKPWIEGESDDLNCTVFELLVVFDDKDEETGKVWDQEVAPVGYRPEGKFYVEGSHWQTEITDFHKARISSWCFMPDGPKTVIKEIA
jgi:hypothetical protein